MDQHAFDAARYCSESFPCSTGDIHPGMPMHFTDTLYMPGDSVECPDQFPDAGKKVPCPPTKIIRDSIHVTDTLSVADSAHIAYLSGQRDSAFTAAKIARIAAENAIKGEQEWKSKAKARGWTIYGFLAAIGLFGCIWLYLKFKPF